ncbi:hypothetical protein [Bradyrhizobium sp. NP1]|nr:hypothetical protein [Bradyrhizobium sp. NP1]WJR81067.1 hypothetical protein QOU61_15325 [Bradyrhizobium sp. NP1]
MYKFQLFLLGVLLASLLLATNVQPFSEWFDVLILGGYVLFFG